MFIMREVVHCRPGKAGEMVKRFKGLSAIHERLGFNPIRVMTDVSGERFWTVVAETEYENMDQFGQMEEKVFGLEETRKLMSGYHEVIAEGRREWFKLQA